MSETIKRMLLAGTDSSLRFQLFFIFVLGALHINITRRPVSHVQTRTKHFAQVRSPTHTPAKPPVDPVNLVQTPNPRAKTRAKRITIQHARAHPRITRRAVGTPRTGPYATRRYTPTTRRHAHAATVTQTRITRGVSYHAQNRTPRADPESHVRRPDPHHPQTRIPGVRTRKTPRKPALHVGRTRTTARRLVLKAYTRVLRAQPRTTRGPRTQRANPHITCRPAVHVIHTTNSYRPAFHGRKSAHHGPTPSSRVGFTHHPQTPFSSRSQTSCCSRRRPHQNAGGLPVLRTAVREQKTEGAVVVAPRSRCAILFLPTSHVLAVVAASSHGS